MIAFNTSSGSKSVAWTTFPFQCRHKDWRFRITARGIRPKDNTKVPTIQRFHRTLQTRHTSIMAIRVTGNSTVCSTTCSGQHSSVFMRLINLSKIIGKRTTRFPAPCCPAGRGIWKFPNFYKIPFIGGLVCDEGNLHLGQHEFSNEVARRATRLFRMLLNPVKLGRKAQHYWISCWTNNQCIGDLIHHNGHVTLLWC